jgi:membrane-bound lytic murein transglycosylase A
MFGDLMITGRSGCSDARGSALQRSRQTVLTLPLFLGLFLLAGWIGGCAAPEKHAVFEISSARYPHFTDDMHFDGLEESIQQSLAYLQRVPPDKEFRFGKDSYSAVHLARSMESCFGLKQNRPAD